MSKSSIAAIELNQAFARSVPANQKKRLSEAEWAIALSKFHADAKRIRAKLSLGVMARAMATYRFQKLLLQAGFDAEIVRKVVFSLVLNAFIASE
jgi:hypothetical protein